MPVNNTGRPFMHPTLHQLIQPGQPYPGREVGGDGKFVTAQPVERVLAAEQKEAPKPGASSDIVKLPPAEWPDRATLSAMELPALKAWATAQEVKFHPNAGKDNVLDKIDAARAAATETE